jgi:hypothetical protein
MISRPARMTIVANPPKSTRRAHASLMEVQTKSFSSKSGLTNRRNDGRSHRGGKARLEHFHLLANELRVCFPVANHCGDCNTSAYSFKPTLHSSKIVRFVSCLSLTSSDKMLDTAKIAVISVSAAIVGVILLSIGVSVLSKALEKRKERKRQTQDAVVIPEESAEDQRLRRRLEEEDAEAEADRAYFGWTAAVR